MLQMFLFFLFKMQLRIDICFFVLFVVWFHLFQNSKNQMGKLILKKKTHLGGFSQMVIFYHSFLNHLIFFIIKFSGTLKSWYCIFNNSLFTQFAISPF